MTGGRKGGGGRLADAAVAAGDNDSHVADHAVFQQVAQSMPEQRSVAVAVCLSGPKLIY
jgi:hypothetical protein